MFIPEASWVMSQQRGRELRFSSEKMREADSRRRNRLAAIETRPEPAVLRRPAIRWPQRVGAAPAIRIGPFVEVGAIGALGSDGTVLHPGDPYAQAKAALSAMTEALERLGAGVCDVVRTRVYLKKVSQWQEVGRAHNDFFEEIRPVTTFVGAGAFVHPDELVEIEATAFLRS